jgi:SAM-dependent methyltransferase
LWTFGKPETAAMANLFNTRAMAEGYAAFRPPLHRLILKRMKPHLPWHGKASRALDIGCGAGLSTRALEDMADRRIGLEPAEPMLRGSAQTVPGAGFIVGRAEALPIREHCVDLITAAGSLNYVDLPPFFAEAARILNPGGWIVVYDFSSGRSFRDADGLDAWFASFIARYPWPTHEGVELDPERLANVDPRFELRRHEYFDIGLTLTPAFYLEYMLTETNVAHAMRSGVSEREIRTWCASTLEPVWGDRSREVLFHGYFACLTPREQPEYPTIPQSGECCGNAPCSEARRPGP